MEYFLFRAEIWSYFCLIHSHKTEFDEEKILKFWINSFCCVLSLYMCLCMCNVHTMANHPKTNHGTAGSINKYTFFNNVLKCWKLFFSIKFIHKSIYYKLWVCIIFWYFSLNDLNVDDLFAAHANVFFALPLSHSFFSLRMKFMIATNNS